MASNDQIKIHWDSESGVQIKENLVIYGKKALLPKYFFILISLKIFDDDFEKDLFYYEVDFKSNNEHLLPTTTKNILIGEENEFEEITRKSNLKEMIGSNNIVEKFKFGPLEEDGTNKREIDFKTNSGLDVSLSFNVKHGNSIIEEIEVSLDNYRDNQYHSSHEGIDRSKVELNSFFVGKELIETLVTDIEDSVRNFYGSFEVYETDEDGDLEVHEHYENVEIDTEDNETILINNEKVEDDAEENNRFEDDESFFGDLFDEEFQITRTETVNEVNVEMVPEQRIDVIRIKRNKNTSVSKPYKKKRSQVLRNVFIFVIVLLTLSSVILCLSLIYLNSVYKDYAEPEVTASLGRFQKVK